MTLSELERTAYVAGDLERAALLADLEDAEIESRAEEKAHSDEYDQAVAEKDFAESALLELNSKITDRLRELESLIENAKRVGNRSAIEAKLSQLWALL